jgi:hypothetical protein
MVFLLLLQRQCNSKSCDSCTLRVSISPRAASSAATHEQAPRSGFQRRSARRSQHRIQRQFQQGEVVVIAADVVIT